MLTLETYINAAREAVAPYYLTNDAAHGIDHADDVCDNALEIAKFIAARTGTEPTARSLFRVVAAAYCHDMFSKRDPEIRRDHHEKAFEYVMVSPAEFLSEFSEKERLEIALACREHRSSWKGSMSSILSTTIATADRGVPNLDKYLMRSYKYAVDSLGLETKEALLHSIHHIHTKYGFDGNSNQPPLWYEVHADKLTCLQEDLEALSDMMTTKYGISFIVSADTTPGRSNVSKVIAPSNLRSLYPTNNLLFELERLHKEKRISKEFMEIANSCFDKFYLRRV